MSESEAPYSGRYIIQDPIGEGGSGDVFSAWDQQLGREVAIKRIRADAVIEASIRKEAGILATLNHPNIVTIFDFAADENGPFVVMELVQGLTLEKTVAQHPLSLARFLEMANQVCRGLSAAHVYGLVHRDIKPGNLMLVTHHDNSFTLKILDFGLALTDSDEGAPSDGTVVGTPWTISPEQLEGRSADIRSDVYSLGCVFYFALSGRYPHDAADIPTIVQNHLIGKPRALHHLKPEIPQPISVAISKMMSRDPAARQQTVEEVRLAIRGAARAPSGNTGTRPFTQPLMGASRAGTTSRHIVQPVGPPQPAASSVIQPPASAYETAAPVQAAPAAKSPAMMWIAPIAVAALVGGLVAWFTAGHQPGNSAQNSTAATQSTVPPVVTAPTPLPMSPEAANAPSVDPTDRKAVLTHLGESAKVEGTIVAVISSDLFHSEYLKFATPSQTMVVSITHDKLSHAEASSLIGRKIRAFGKIANTGGTLRLVVDVRSDLEVFN